MMRFRLAVAICVMAGPAFTAQPTDEQKEMRAGLLRITLAEECQKITGDDQIVADAISALEVTAERNFPDSAAEISRNARAYVENRTGRETSPSGLVTTATCKRIRDSINEALKP